MELADRWLDSAVDRLPRWMAGLTIASALVALGTGHVQFAAGFAVGAAAAILAYRWLHRAVATALESSGTRPARTMMLKFAMRYPLLVVVVVLCFKTGWLPLGGVVAGLFVPAAAALVECLVLAGRLLRNGWAGSPEALPPEGSQL